MDNPWSKLIRLLKSYLSIQNILNIIKFDGYVNATKTLRHNGCWLKKIHIISVDTQQIYNDQFNLKRYCIGWFNLFVLNFAVFLLNLLISNQWFIHRFYSEFLPKNFKIICSYLLLPLLITISVRFDLLLAQWNGNISVFKVFYYVQENIKSNMN